MGTVSLWMQTSLDGFMQGPAGELDWPVVEEEVHSYFNAELRGADTFLYGRRVYEGMAEFWPNADSFAWTNARHHEYAEIWKPMPKVVFSRTLAGADWNARVVADDVAGEVVRLREQPDSWHVLFGGADIAATFVAQDLVDEYRLFVHPVILGGGTPVFPPLEERVGLSLVEARTFDAAVVHVRYRRAV